MAKPKKSPHLARSRGTMGNGKKLQSAAKVARKGVEKNPRQAGTGKSTKIASMTVLLCRIKGVSLNELCKHTGWQPHSVRAVISSVIKKKLGLEVVSETIGGERIYRVIV